MIYVFYWLFAWYDYIKVSKFRYGFAQSISMAVCIEFGPEIAVFLFLFNLLACFCQYLSVHIALVCNRTLAQICYIEYGKVNSIFLGIQQQISMIMSDLAMVELHFFSTACSLDFTFCLVYDYYVFFVQVLATAFGLSAILRVNLFSAVILASLDAFLYPFFSFLLVRPKAVFLLVQLAVIISLSFVLVMLIGLPEKSVSYTFVSSTSVGVNFSALMSILGANVMPRYLHSSFLQPLVFLLLMIFSHISYLSWDFSGEGRQTMFYDFFRIDFPYWLHRVVVRIFVIISALCSLRYSGVEGMYQMLISTEIMLTLLLPVSVVSLYRIASCGALMGMHTISSAMKFIIMMSLMGIIGLQFLFLGEMVFGDDDPYSILLLSCCVSIFFTFRIFVTPLRTHVRRFNVLEQERCNGEERYLVRRISNPEEDSNQAFRIVQPLATNGGHYSNGLDEVNNSSETFLTLTRSARIEMAAILNEFWGQLYDYNGQFTQAAKGKKLHLMFGGSVGRDNGSTGLYGLETCSMCAKQPFEQFDVANKAVSAVSVVKLLWSFRRCILMLMRVKGSKWLFRQTNGMDEELVRRVAAKERYLYKIDPDHKVDLSVPNCGDSCVWKADLVVNFGVWCFRRVLELSLDNYYPELWREYTSVLNRLQGVIDVSCSNKLKPTHPCICLKLEPGKKTTSPALMNIVKDKETFLFSKKPNSSTAMAFSMEKGYLVPTLQCYKRHLSELPSNHGL